MALFLIFALMTGLALSAVLLPLMQTNTRIQSGGDLAVYRDQLEELERDRKSGFIGEPEAVAAHLEISRRLLAAADVAKTGRPEGKASTWARRMVVVAALVALPIGAASLYLLLGSPLLPSQPFAARIILAPVQRPTENPLSKLETELERDPNNGSVWQDLARAYMQVERFNDAIIAWRSALRILGDSAERQSDLGQSLMAAANGIVTAEAQAAFERAVALDPNIMIARFFLGVAAEQDGRREDAARIWREMIVAAPAGAPWLGLVRESLNRVEDNHAKGIPGPDADDLEAAAKLTPEQQTEVIRGMVSRLAMRLKENGSGHLDDWLKLIRAYVILGERDRAKAAISDARRALMHDGDKLRRIDDLVKALGVEG